MKSECVCRVIPILREVWGNLRNQKLVAFCAAWFAAITTIAAAQGAGTSFAAVELSGASGSAATQTQVSTQANTDTTYSFQGASGEIRITKIGTFPCGKQPKQVLFTPDDEYIVMPLLDENGFDIFSLTEKKVIKRINPPESIKLGFVEGLFIP